ncbi:phage repressor protein [Salmonella enterica subsp. diarizonae]|uniref:Phage repressor protein n=1 Tax=Salmonella enterica I TaxID=59201 RepID=A0A5U3EQC3_SALET|nr:phage repressor protein CI [Salmonella enterica]AXC67282.1 phage repressor protein [Salmonella enterica subsp. diarizonae serovar 59:z10:-]EBP3999215.1 phage repressor protein [Salmonella enterica subsp. enterica]ECC1748120.1 phage repressor protein [Salmonella enterica subsp. diarizonae]ECF1926864.1 phage repressor protein [Salmonella enterica subsp. enterica serovar Java]EDD7085998.1 phage repressor protein [Salmonella enterica subsp. enterica serovar Enteritidis]EHS1317503.1 phage repre
MSTSNITLRHIGDNLKASIMQNRGGQKVIERILKAYGFQSRQAFCNHLGVSQSTMANRYARDTFPADWVVICSLETGASLQWLSSGEGTMYEDGKDERAVTLSHKKISNGVLTSPNEILCDKSEIPTGLSSPFIVSVDKTRFLVDVYDGEITDGFWLVEIDGLVSVREIYRFPGGRVRIENGKASFECKATDVKVLGKVVSKTELLNA